jgi:DNA (cytosine-5)-methyltransferase 1
LISHTLRSEGFDASEDGTGCGTPTISDKTGVRRLTPTECERLQALPDGWTQLGDTPDGRRYSALGDAVTATVGEWIGRRLLAAHAQPGGYAQRAGKE